MTNDIFFSVMVCCYNSGKYLRETIDSIINQTYTNWELIAVNDGSSDNTEKIIIDYIHQGIPITYYKQENKGFASARNKAMELANSNWIAIIDHDDICLPNRLEIQVDQILHHSQVKLFFANTIHFSDENHTLRHQYDRFNPNILNLSKGESANHLLSHGCFIDSEAVIFNKKAAQKINGFDARYKYVVDYDFFIRMGLDYDMFTSKETVSKWRVHAEQATQKMGNLIYLEEKSIFMNYFTHDQIKLVTKAMMILNHVKRSIKKYARISKNLFNKNIAF